MMTRKYVLACDSPLCDALDAVDGATLADAVKAARAKDWAVGRDRCTCFCPRHASRYRSIGRAGHGVDYSLNLPT